jgi:hypothetical protein
MFSIPGTNEALGGVNCGDAWRHRKNVLASSSTEGAGMVMVSIVGFASSGELLSTWTSGSTLLLRSFSSSLEKINCSRLVEYKLSSLYADILLIALLILTSATSYHIVDAAQILHPCALG